MKTARQKEARESLTKKTAAVREMVKAGQYKNANTAIIAEFYNPNQDKEFNTFAAWKKQGFTVLKGAKGYPVWGRPKTIENENGEEKQFFPISYLFSNEQVRASADFIKHLQKESS